MADDTRNEVGGKMADVVYLADVRVRKLLRRLADLAERLEWAESTLGNARFARRYAALLNAALGDLDETIRVAKRPALVTVPAGAER